MFLASLTLDESLTGFLLLWISWLTVRSISHGEKIGESEKDIKHLTEIVRGMDSLIQSINKYFYERIRKRPM